MTDDAEFEAAVLPEILQAALGRPPHRDTAEDKRTGAVGGFFGFVIASLFADLNDDVELPKSPPRDARRFENGGERLEFAGRTFPGTRHQVWEAGDHSAPPLIECAPTFKRAPSKKRCPKAEHRPKPPAIISAQNSARQIIV
jgi:hypothetical protein